MNRVLTAERAVLLQLKPFCIVLLVLKCLIVSLLAFCACKSDLITRTGLCHGLIPPKLLSEPLLITVLGGANLRTKRRPLWV